MARRARNIAVRNAATAGLVAGIYLRISQDREGKRYGEARQREMSLAVAAKLSATVYREYSDNDISASTLSEKPRPEYDRMLADAKAGHINCVIALSTSRLTRRSRENEDLLDLAWNHGVTFHYAKSPAYDLNTADGREAARVAAARDTGETERMAERVRDARRQKAMDPEQCGFGGGRRPFGYGVVIGYDPRTKTDIVDYGQVREDEAAEIRKAADQLLAKVSLRAIAADMQRRGVPTVTGAPWDPTVLRDILLRPRNAGHLVYLGEIVGNKPELEILTEDVWRAVTAFLTAPERCTHLPTGRAPRWLGSGLYGCCQCDATAQVWVYARRERQPPRYRCKKGGSRHLFAPVQDVDDEVIDWVVGWLTDKRHVAAISQPRTPGVDTAALRTERAAKAALLDQYVRDEVAGLRTRQQVITATGLITARLAEIDSVLKAATGQSAAAPLLDVEDVRAAWHTLSLGVRRAILAELFKIAITADGTVNVTAR